MRRRSTWFLQAADANSAGVHVGWSLPSLNQVCDEDALCPTFLRLAHPDGLLQLHRAHPGALPQTCAWPSSRPARSAALVRRAQRSLLSGGQLVPWLVRFAQLLETPSTYLDRVWMTCEADERPPPQAIQVLGEDKLMVSEELPAPGGREGLVGVLRSAPISPTR